VDLLVVRHAESTWNARHRWAGQRDPGLSAKGRQDASEPMEAFTVRVVAALGELSGSLPGGRAVVVAHQGVLRALEHHFGVAPATAAELRGVWLRAVQGDLAWPAHW
jgi:broad specificity phosphatase PhoE